MIKPRLIQLKDQPLPIELLPDIAKAPQTLQSLESMLSAARFHVGGVPGQMRETNPLLRGTQPYLFSASMSGKFASSSLSGSARYFRASLGTSSTSVSGDLPTPSTSTCLPYSSREYIYICVCVLAIVMACPFVIRMTVHTSPVPNTVSHLDGKQSLLVKVVKANTQDCTSLSQL